MSMRPPLDNAGYHEANRADERLRSADPAFR